jgi:hypothetical protein
MNEPTWTINKPTISGWYWYCETGHDFPKDADVVEVDLDSYSIPKVYQVAEESAADLKYFNGYWAGPIAKPFLAK